MKFSRSVLLVLTSLVMLVMSGCYFLPEEEEVLEAPVVKASEVSYTTTTAALKDITKQVLTAGTIASGTEYNARFSGGGNIKGVYVNAGDVIEKGHLIAEYETYELDGEIELMELEMKREQLEYEIALERDESENVKAKELLDIQLLQNELDKLYAKKEAAKLYSNEAGTVSFVKTCSPGDWINGGEVIATVIDITNLYIKIDPDDDVGEFMVGRPITIRYEGEYYEGTIIESTTGKTWDPDTLSAKVDENGEVIKENVSDRIIVKFNDLIPESNAVGNIADTLLILDKREQVIVISANLIKKVGGVDCVYVFENNQKVQRNVTIGLRSGSLCEITSGLEVGDEIIIR